MIFTKVQMMTATTTTDYTPSIQDVTDEQETTTVNQPTEIVRNNISIYNLQPKNLIQTEVTKVSSLTTTQRINTKIEEHTITNKPSITTDRMTMSEKNPEINSTKQNQLLYKIENLGMQDQIQMDSENINIAKFGTYIRVLRKVTSHSSFIKLVIPYRDKPNIRILQSVEATIRLAAKTVTDTSAILKLKQGTEMLDKYHRTTVSDMCNGPNTPEFINLTTTQITTACTTYAVSEILIELHTHTRALLLDAESRIQRARNEIISLRRWFPRRNIKK